MVSPIVFNETKNALLRHYASNQSSQSARLIGFLIGLFTLLQTVQHSEKEPLAGIFKNIEFALTFEIHPIVGDMFKLLLFSVFVWVSLVFIVRTIFRFPLFSYSSDCLITLKLSDISENSKKPIHSVIQEATFDMVCAKKVFGIFRLSWFISRGTGKEHRTGVILCMFLAFLATLILIWFL